jgi:inorganic pyrophosphatase
MKTYRLTFDFKNGKQIEIDITCDEEIIDDVAKTIKNEIQHFSWYVKLDNGNKIKSEEVSDED